MKFEGKTIVVTGTSRGLGAQTAQQLQAAGARVIGLDKNETTAHVDRYIPLDLADGGSIKTAVSQIDEPIHGLCNIAGVAPTLPPDLVLKINFLGTRQLTEALLPKIEEGGSVVHIASGTGMGWARNIAKHKVLRELSLADDIDAFCTEYEIVKANSYHFSKEAIIAWTVGEWKRREERDVRMNAVSPGPIETPLLPDFLSDMTTPDAPMFEMKNSNATPEDVANVVLFLLDDASRWIHAANIPVDGGLSAIVQKRIFQF
ncbi:MAG: coniferyl-alcohol dehydrogenase [Chloroflexota bacterium]